MNYLISAMFYRIAGILEDFFGGKTVFHTPRFLFTIAADTSIGFTSVESHRHPFFGRIEEFYPWVYAEWKNRQGFTQRAFFQMPSHDLDMASVWKEYKSFMEKAELNPTMLTDYPADIQKILQQYLTS